jgi:hypothetical protein
MQALIIGSRELKQKVEDSISTQLPEINPSILWAHELESAFGRLEKTDVDAIIFDIRRTGSDKQDTDTELKSLLANLPVTTRVLAIVERLPDDDMFYESGVVYLTPPVNLEDINWFIRTLQSTA